MLLTRRQWLLLKLTTDRRLVVESYPTGSFPASAAVVRTLGRGVAMCTNECSGWGMQC